MAQNLNVGMKCIKYMLFISNLMFVMVGILLISFGSTIKSIYYDFELFMEDHYFSPSKLCIAIGIIILMISAFGSAAALKESTCMVNLYSMFLILALILEISAAIAAYTMRLDIGNIMEKKMISVMKNYQNDSESKSAVDYLQYQLNCCGVHNAEEWYFYTNFTTLPTSCCRNDLANTILLDENCLTSGIGCLDALSYIVQQSSIMLGSGALCVAFVQVLGIIFGLMLAKSIRRIKTEREVRRWQSKQELYLQLERDNAKQPAIQSTTYTPESSPDA